MLQMLKWALAAMALCASALSVLILVALVQAAAQTASEPVPGVDPNQTLSDQLNQDKGVIVPPPVGDEAIHVPAPNPSPGTTRVIPPPGTEGGDPEIQPK
ncbi:hypothetical protein AUC69_02965 [Methyloceanibacter superfactus]|jgi:hypothetical protein|uniref:Secreted protein n=1 Tax=Methyloceanibacter superfactus TaxID=1774969 RepID=A0A1E3VNB2_9HYPH|nr:hypothetical protein [Methyloceanibacter superfactus]ODR94791.1 hypothetical protein AUC69_02965 [Methyloceanibacter superfactus]